jgi:hypothetical protein
MTLPGDPQRMGPAVSSHLLIHHLHRIWPSSHAGSPTRSALRCAVFVWGLKDELNHSQAGLVEAGEDRVKCEACYAESKGKTGVFNRREKSKHIGGKKHIAVFAKWEEAQQAVNSGPALLLASTSAPLQLAPSNINAFHLNNDPGFIVEPEDFENFELDGTYFDPATGNPLIFTAGRDSAAEESARLALDEARFHCDAQTWGIMNTEQLGEMFLQGLTLQDLGVVDGAAQDVDDVAAAHAVLNSTSMSDSICQSELN